MMSELLSGTLADDSFFLNLGTILLKMCQPFLDPNSTRLLKINPHYCATVTSTGESAGIHCTGLEEETRLINCDDGKLDYRQ